MRLARLDELHIIGGRIYAETENLPKEEKKRKVADEIYEILLLAYIFGQRRVSEDAQTDAQKAYEAIYKKVAGETFEERVARHIEEGTFTEEVLQRIIETDYHRVEETAAYETAETVEAETGKKAYKRWLTMLDDRVRDTHWDIEGVEVPIGERFYTFDDDSARFPGDFEKAENNVNCRCELEYFFK